MRSRTIQEMTLKNGEVALEDILLFHFIPALGQILYVWKRYVDTHNTCSQASVSSLSGGRERPQLMDRALSVCCKAITAEADVHSLTLHYRFGCGDFSFCFDHMCEYITELNNCFYCLIHKKICYCSNNIPENKGIS